VGITLGPVKTHTVQVGDVTRELPIVEVAPGVNVALFNMLGDTEVTEAAGQALARLLPPDIDDPVAREVISITTGIPQLLVLDGFDVPKVRNRKVAIVDDVVSSGGTLHSLRQIIDEVGGEVAAVMAVFTEGEEREEVTALGHLPLFPGS
jgi:adenine phosphoribosyltransferase